MTKNNQVVKHHGLDAFLKGVQDKDIPNLILVFGEPYLIKKAIKSISMLLLGDDQVEYAQEILEGGFVSMGDIIEHVSTFSFLVPKKMVLIKNIPLFQFHQKTQEINFTSAELDLFVDYIGKGIPRNHYLVLTASTIDKRKKVYKAIQENGLIIDCSVAKGARKVDLDEQRAVLQSVAEQFISRAGKTLDNQAFHALVDLTGFNLDQFSQNLEKLITYAGKNQHITLADIKAVIKRERKDPVFNLTNALMDKDKKNAVFYLSSLLSEGYHPLQILKSFENQFRKLILVKCFAVKWYQENKLEFKKMNFNLFRQTVLPLIIRHDKDIRLEIDTHEKYLTEEGQILKKNKSTDLFLAPNPKNAYPVYQVFQKSDCFTLNELNQIILFLSDIDYKMKSSSFDEKTTLEGFIIAMCSKGGFAYDEKKHKNRRYHL